MVVTCGRWFRQSLCPTSFSTSHDHSSIQAKPSVGCVSQDFKACSEWKSETVRTWRWTGTGVGYLRHRQFACCLVFRLQRQHSVWRVLIEWDYRVDETPALLSSLPSHLNLWSTFRSGTSSCEAARRPAKIDFWRLFQSEPGQCDMASTPSKLIFLWYQSDQSLITWHGQQALKEWLVKQFPQETSRCPQQRPRPFSLFFFAQFPSKHSGWQLRKEETCWNAWESESQLPKLFCLKSATAKCDISMLFIVEGQHFHDRKEIRTRMDALVAETKRWTTKAGSGSLDFEISWRFWSPKLLNLSNHWIVWSSLVCF